MIVFIQRMKQRRNKKGIIVLVGLLLGFASCKEGVPDDVIQPMQMENLLYDYHVAKSMAENLSQKERYKRKLYYEFVLKKHHVDKAKFDSSMVWYTRHTEELNKLYDNISKRLHKEQDQISHLIAIRDNKPKESAPGDSVDIWVGNKLYALTASAMLNKVIFEIPADNQFMDKDWFVWRLRYTFLPFYRAGRGMAIAVMYAKYNNDSIVSVTKHLDFSGVDSLTLSSNISHKLNKLKGYIYYQCEDSDGGLLIDGISLTRYRYVGVVDSAATDTLVKPVNNKNTLDVNKSKTLRNTSGRRPSANKK